VSPQLARAVNVVPAPRFSSEGAKAAGLRIVRPVRSRARKAPFVVVVLTLLSIGLVGLIVMSTVLQAQSFKAAALNSEANALETRQQGLTRDVERLQSPANVARRALVYGMVPNATPAFLRLSDGKVLGTPEPAVRGNNITRVSQ
jgi:cell division protein FtsB